MGYILQIPSQLSSHLRALRKAKGLSQAELGKRLGLSQTRVARIEGDPLSISVEQLLRVLAVLGFGVTLVPSPNVSVALKGQSIESEAGKLKAKAAQARNKDKEDW